jgi:hypothetical protein
MGRHQDEFLVARERSHGRIPGHISWLRDKRADMEERVHDCIPDHMDVIRVDALGEKISGGPARGREMLSCAQCDGPSIKLFGPGGKQITRSQSRLDMRDRYLVKEPRNSCRRGRRCVTLHDQPLIWARAKHILNLLSNKTEFSGETGGIDDVGSGMSYLDIEQIEKPVGQTDMLTRPEHVKLYVITVG